MGYLKNKLKEIGASRFQTDDEISVLVELSMRKPDDECVRQLQDAGLTIEQVFGNKVVGSIPGKAESVLESLPIVTSIERSVKLKPH